MPVFGNRSVGLRKNTTVNTYLLVIGSENLPGPESMSLELDETLCRGSGAGLLNDFALILNAMGSFKGWASANFGVQIVDQFRQVIIMP